MILKIPTALLLFACLNAIAWPQTRDAGEQVSAYTSIELRPWLSIALPSNWQVQSEGMTGTVAAAMEAHGVDVTATLQSFSANLILPEIRQSPARMNVRFYPDPEKPSNDQVELLGSHDVEYFDSQLRTGTEEGIQRIGGRITEWYGSELVQIDGRFFIVTSYQRDLTSNPGGDVSNVFLHRYWDAERSFTLTTACQVNFCSIGQPILYHIQNSIDID